MAARRTLPECQPRSCYCGGDLVLERGSIDTLEALRSLQGVPYAGGPEDLPARLMTYRCRNGSLGRADGCGRAWHLVVGPRGEVGRRCGSIDPFKEKPGRGR